jgi:rod shape-determining protein MreD
MKALKILPFLSLLVAILGVSCLTLGGYPLLPSLFLIPVYYWLVYRPDLIPLLSLFFLGFFYDALLGNEFGISSALLVTSSFFAQYFRPFLNPHLFHYIWGGFIIYSLGYMGLYALLTWGGFPLLISWIYGLVLYPLVAWSLGTLHARVQSYA